MTDLNQAALFAIRMVLRNRSISTCRIPQRSLSSTRFSLPPQTAITLPQHRSLSTKQSWTRPETWVDFLEDEDDASYQLAAESSRTAAARATTGAKSLKLQAGKGVEQLRAGKDSVSGTSKTGDKKEVAQPARMALTDKHRCPYCRPLLELVVADTSESLSRAKDIRAEILSYGHQLEEDERYIMAAERQLRARSSEDFLMWLSLYPTRTKRTIIASTHVLDSHFYPIIQLLHHRQRQQKNSEVVANFISICADKGLLSTILPPLMDCLTATFDPARSWIVLKDALERYQSWLFRSITPINQASRAKDALKQISSWLDLYLQKILEQGHVEFADRVILPHLQAHGVVLSSVTQRWMTMRAAHSNGASSLRPVYPPFNHGEPLVLRLKHATEDPPAPMDLAEVIRATSRVGSWMGKKSYYSRFLAMYGFENINRQNLLRVRLKRRHVQWYKASILILQGTGDHAAAVEYFGSHFVPFGIPPHPFLDWTVQKGRHRRLLRAYPDTEALDTILPSLIYTLPPAEQLGWGEFWRDFVSMNSTLAPASRIDSAVVNKVVAIVAQRFGFSPARRALGITVEHGLAPEEPACAALLIALAKSGQTEALMAVLGRMSREEVIGWPENGVHGFKWPKPSQSTMETVRQLREESVLLGLRAANGGVTTMRQKRLNARMKRAKTAAFNLLSRSTGEGEGRM